MFCLLLAPDIIPAYPVEVYRFSPAVGPVIVIVAIAVAVRRYSLFELKIIIRRVAIYAGLTSALTAVFVAAYFLMLRRGLVESEPRWLPFFAAAVAVFCAESARRRLQRRVERRLLGDRSEPMRAMERLRERTLAGSGQFAWPGLVATVAAAVRSPSVELWLHRGGEFETVAATGPCSAGCLVLPLVHRGERLGELRVDPRTPGESYGRRDRALLGQLADQAAAHVYGDRRDAELVAARQQALTATNAERSRLGADLHDGLAPLIAGAGLAAEALRRGMMPGSQDERDAGILAQRLRSAATELREIAQGLQPSPLAEHGLAGAIDDYIATLTGPDVPVIEVSTSTGNVPPAIEAVVYRVVLEGVANVVRHARARRCTVTVSLTIADVTVEIRDDGTGLRGPYISGVGVSSMRGRVEAVGGVFELESHPGGGTMVYAKLPLNL